MKVTVNGRDITTISEKQISYINLPSDLPVADELTVSLSYGKESQIKRIVDLSVYGASAKPSK